MVGYQSKQYGVQSNNSILKIINKHLAQHLKTLLILLLDMTQVNM